MTAITFIISVVSLACGCAALIIAMRESKKQTSIVRVEKAPVEHPFIYDDEKQCYTLDGSLEVTGSVTALKKGGKA